MNPHNKVIQESAAILNAAKHSIKETLETEPDLKNLSETIFNQIGIIEKRFYSLSGLPEKELENTGNEFKPITKIMGIQVDQRKPITEETTTPTQTEKEKLIDRIKEFYERIPKMSNEKILEVTREPKGVSILRGAAKLANVENWRDAELDILFIEDIKAGIKGSETLNTAIDAAHSQSDSGQQTSDEVKSPWQKDLPESQTTVHASSEINSLQQSEQSPKLNELKDIVKSDYQKNEESKGSNDDSIKKEAGTSDGSGQSDETNTSNEGADTELTKAQAVIEAKRLKEEGLTVKEIAEKLGKSTGTISNYLNDK
ncbi:helix-turn-helix domain-containing protein [Taibaiella lutea]|uniref:Helix-turn-helix domain-containing protein n=1 Tax=Taibaiella lutea TaxID=2608001 RepID=A0A5M6CBY6_9BACT|nr:helix-turn-helix domain-containing protein [Taibaiella lutea]KAA5532664.1 helix-turn-helix domain-containing protein [Taibaiella lutea]